MWVPTSYSAAVLYLHPFPFVGEADLCDKPLAALAGEGTFKVGDGNFQAHRRITFRNCQSYRSMSALKVTHGYGTEPAEDIVFENIDIEGFGGRNPTAKWMDFYLLSDGPVNNVTVRNVNIRPERGFDATLKGKNDRFFYDDVTIEGIVIAGQPVHSLEDMRITNRNAYVRNLIVR